MRIMSDYVGNQVSTASIPTQDSGDDIACIDASTVRWPVHDAGCFSRHVEFRCRISRIHNGTNGMHPYDLFHGHSIKWVVNDECMIHAT
jgi:hypothetical protein